MNEMIERVAKAMAKADAHNASWKLYVREASAAIEAMREPTAEMGQAIYAAWDKFGEDAVMGPEEAVAIYRAAIDAALGAGQEPR